MMRLQYGFCDETPVKKNETGNVSIIVASNILRVA